MGNAQFVEISCRYVSFVCNAGALHKHVYPARLSDQCSSDTTVLRCIAWQLLYVWTCVLHDNNVIQQCMYSVYNNRARLQCGAEWTCALSIKATRLGRPFKLCCSGGFVRGGLLYFTRRCALHCCNGLSHLSGTRCFIEQYI